MRAHWSPYIARPFDLFGTSLWVHWYVSSVINEALGMRFRHIRCEQLPNKLVKQFHLPAEKALFHRKLHDLARQTQNVNKIFHRAHELNRLAQQYLNRVPQNWTLQNAVHFYEELAVYNTILPFQLEPHISRNQPGLMKEILTLRKKSYYPDVLQRIVVPLARQQLREYKIPTGSLHLLTCQELLKKRFRNLVTRKTKQKGGLCFVYVYNTGDEKILWRRPRIQGVDTTNLIGTVAFAGIVKGRVKIITHKKEMSKFRSDDVLVAVSTNPELLPIMKRARAIITDEGGITSHAAIIARELKKPCIIGTKIATRALKDGDRVEVDATKGIIKKL